MKKAAKDVDAYIKAAPKEAQAKLTQLRKAIQTAAPRAEERISYRMPYYHYLGRLAYFAAFKNHIGLYIPPPIIEDHQRELKAYGTAKSAVRFPLLKPLPLPLIKKLIKARVQHNAAKAKKAGKTPR